MTEVNVTSYKEYNLNKRRVDMIHTVSVTKYQNDPSI